MAPGWPLIRPLACFDNDKLPDRTRESQLGLDLGDVRLLIGYGMTPKLGEDEV